jgi:hypothetical protein
MHPARIIRIGNAASWRAVDNGPPKRFDADLQHSIIKKAVNPKGDLTPSPQ